MQSVLINSLLIGVIAGMVESRQVFTPEVRIFALIGVLGGFTACSLGIFIEERNKHERLPLIDDAIVEGLATVEKVDVHFYRAGNEEPDS